MYFILIKLKYIKKKKTIIILNSIKIYSISSQSYMDPLNHLWFLSFCKIHKLILERT